MISVNGRTVDSVTVCVKGDLDGDGDMDGDDLDIAVGYLLGTAVPEKPVFYAAADVDQNGTVNVTDFIIIADAVTVPVPPDDTGEETDTAEPVTEPETPGTEAEP